MSIKNITHSPIILNKMTLESDIKYQLGDTVSVYSRSKETWKEGTILFPINIFGKFVRNTKIGVSVEYSDDSGYTNVSKEEFSTRLKLIQKFLKK